MADHNQNIRVGIIGLGPVGMVLAIKLKGAGCDVSLCVRNEVKRERIKEQGIVLENVITASAPFDKVYATIADMAENIYDFVVIAVKTYDNSAVVDQLMPLIGDNTMLVLAQNGIDVEDSVAPFVGESRILRMVVNYAGNSISPNRVKVTFFSPPNYIGSINDANETAAITFAGLLNDVNLHTEPVGSFELLRRVWEKTILNSSLSALCGVGRLTMAEAMSDPDTIELIEQIINEAVEVAEKEKIRYPDDFIRQCMRYLKHGGDHFPSLAVDLINGKQTEIDFFNGKIVEYGRKHYVRTSLNLSFYNMVKAMTNKTMISRVPGITADVSRKILEKGLVNRSLSPASCKSKPCFLGIDLGSAYSKFTVLDSNDEVLFRYFLPTLSSDKYAFKNILKTIQTHFDIQHRCATGYGRKHFNDADIVKTEINCAATAVSHFYDGEKNIIDIGGEDIKVIRCNADNTIQNFYMNDKCAAGTGAFLVEIAERAAINIAEMSSLASLSTNETELNSFCTVFAKTEIMSWIFDGMSPEDISKGIYLSIGNKIAKMRLDPGMPTYIIGGVIAHHPYLITLLNEKFNKDIKLVEHPQFVVSLGAALLAKKYNYTKLPERIEV